ncbi:hypothetical protein ACLEJQ_04965 [Pseudomonas sp. SMV71]|uniref:hypothetical protein n=1 Tax=unclassified Pseudomonas TaxID=196821 RepID=UPI003F855FBD
MDVYRIEFEEGRWTLYKAHGYKIIMRAETHRALIDHLHALAQGKAAVVRFAAPGGVRELRIGEVQEDGS